MFTVGFIIYELLMGTHPVLLAGEDKSHYKKRMKEYTGL